MPFENLEVRQNVRSGQSSEELTKEWFGGLKKWQIRRLYDIYQVFPTQILQQKNSLKNQFEFSCQVDFVLYGYTDAQVITKDIFLKK